MKPVKIQFQIVYSDFMGRGINIDVKDINHGKDFTFSLIEKCYTQEEGRTGQGLQVSEDMNEENVKKMCLKISEAIFDYYKET